MTDPSLPLDPRAEELFREYLARVDAGEPADFEALCRANPALVHDLRELKRAIEIARRLNSSSDDRTLSERLKQKFGTDPGPTASLDDEPRPDSSGSSTLFERLRGGGTRGTRYKLLGEVARGGMGVILKIWDDELRRTLAMKVVLGRGNEPSGQTPVVDPNMLGRFLEEAQVTGQLDHPGIVPVHELGLDADGRVYFTMRLVKGEDLRSIFEKVRSGEDGWNQVRALGVLLKVCEAMSYAHSKKVVHRDLKPANVMVGKFGEVYVMDWGLARVLGREDKHDLRIQPQPTMQSVVKTERRERREDTPDSPLVTMDGDIVGTPSFMPPEQAKGQLERLGPHSDVYSLGAMLYQLLTGELPYVPAGAKVSQHTILDAVLRRSPDPIESLAPNTPPELVAICDKAMAREIPARYADTQAFASDLRAYLEGRVVRAYEAGTWAEGKKWVKRNKALTAWMAAASLAVGIGGGVIAQKNSDLHGTNAALAKSKTEAETRAREANLLKDEALAQGRELRVRGLIQDLAQFETLDDSLEFARSQKRPAYEWWLAAAHRLVDGVPEDTQKKVDWSPGLIDAEARLAKLRKRALTQGEADELKDQARLIARLAAAVPEALTKGPPTGPRVWRFAESDDQWWHAQLTQLVEDLHRLEDRIAIAERSVKPPEALTKWNEAIGAIAASPKYAGLKITPQIGLLPIGADPVSGLWEFSQVDSGEVASRAADGRIVLKPEMGLVFVLLPGGRVPAEVVEQGRQSVQDADLTKIDLAAFFVSKYELTNGQWDRLGGWRRAGEKGASPLLPVTGISWDDCVAALSRSVGWLSLPSEAQWEYGCRAGTTTAWWTGNDESSLHGAANIFDPKDGEPQFQRVGLLRANSFGLADVHGNAMEWCRDAYGSAGSTREHGDGLVDALDAANRVLRGGYFWDDARVARSSERFGGAPVVRYDFNGLRPVRGITP